MIRIFSFVHIYLKCHIFMHLRSCHRFWFLHCQKYTSVVILLYVLLNLTLLLLWLFRLVMFWFFYFFGGLRVVYVRHVYFQKRRVDQVGILFVLNLILLLLFLVFVFYILTIEVFKLFIGLESIRKIPFCILGDPINWFSKLLWILYFSIVLNLRTRLLLEIFLKGLVPFLHIESNLLEFLCFFLFMMISLMLISRNRVGCTPSMLFYLYLINEGCRCVTFDWHLFSGGIRKDCLRCFIL